MAISFVAISFVSLPNLDLIQKVLFASVVYILLNRVETFRLVGGIPNEDGFDQFLENCKKRTEKGEKVFTDADQNMGIK